MPELTQEQLYSLAVQVINNRPLEDLFRGKKRFQDMEISIILGFDIFSYMNYTENAFFSKDEAIHFMNTPPYNSPNGEYRLMVTPIRRLENEGVCGEDVLLEGDDIHVIYKTLEDKLRHILFM